MSQPRTSLSLRQDPATSQIIIDISHSAIPLPVKYSLYRNGSLLTELSGSATTYTDVTATQWINVYYTIAEYEDNSTEQSLPTDPIMGYLNTIPLVSATVSFQGVLLQFPTYKQLYISDKYIYGVGRAEPNVVIHPDLSGANGYLIKCDFSGTVITIKPFLNEFQLFQMHANETGIYAQAGNYLGSSIVNIIKFDFNFNEVWQRKLQTNVYNSALGSITATSTRCYTTIGANMYSDNFISVKSETDAILATISDERFASPPPNPINNNSPVIIEFDTDGNYISHKIILCAEGPNNQIRDIHVSDGIYITGIIDPQTYTIPDLSLTYIALTSFRSFIAKLSLSGELIWSKRISSEDARPTFGMAIQSTANAVYATGIYRGNIIVENDLSDVLVGNGDVRSETYLLKYSKTGDLLWAKQFNTFLVNGTSLTTFDDHIQSIFCDGDDIYIPMSGGANQQLIETYKDVSGAIQRRLLFSGGATGKNGYLIKYDGSGALQGRAIVCETSSDDAAITVYAGHGRLAVGFVKTNNIYSIGISVDPFYEPPQPPQPSENIYNSIRDINIVRNKYIIYSAVATNLIDQPIFTSSTAFPIIPEQILPV